MQVHITKGWHEYELLDSGNQKRLERFGKYILKRPDPQAIWSPHLSLHAWEKADARFEKNKEGEEQWEKRTEVPDKWLMHYKNLSFFAKLTPFKHTGVFPEQHLQWDFVEEKIKTVNRPVSILNLFAYTGIASLVAANAGGQVTHVDSSKPTIAWAKENQMASGLQEKPIRWILDDVLKFVAREIKRENFYDGIIMDPPAYGHGPGGKVWEFNQSFPKLLHLCRQVLSKQPLFMIVNAYAISSSAIMLSNMLSEITHGLGGNIEVGELALQEKDTTRLLSTGIFGRWTKY